MPRARIAPSYRAVLAVAALAAVGAGVAGCGSSDSSGTTTSAQRLTEAQITAVRPAYRADIAAAKTVIGPDADTTDLTALAANARAWQKAGEALVTALDSVADDLPDGPCHDALRTVAFLQTAEDAIIGNVADSAAEGNAADAASHLEDYRSVRAAEESKEIREGVLTALDACGVPAPKA